MAKRTANRVTIYRIAEEAGVSPATVSRVLSGRQPVSDVKRSRIEAVVAKYSFRPSSIAQSLAGRKTGVIGFIQPDISHPFYSTLFVAAEQKALELGYTVFLCNTLNDNSMYITDMETNYLRLMREKQVDGIIVSGGRVHDPSISEGYLSEFRNCMAQFPVITVGGRMRSIECPSITTDEPAGIELLVNYLVSLRHERIGFLGGARGIEPTDTRLASFRSCLANHDLEYQEEWHFESGFGMEDGHDAMELLLQLRDKPTAVLCFNDLVAIGAINSAHAHGLSVPGDVSIAGIDNIPFGAYVHPPLTTVDLKIKNQGSVAVQNLIEMIHERPVSQHSVIEPRLAVRQSCGTRE